MRWVQKSGGFKDKPTLQAKRRIQPKELSKMIDKKSFKKKIAAPLEMAGFIKKGQTWYFNGEDILITFNLEKNEWSDQYFVNVGFWIKAFGNALFPSYNHCHLYYRLERLFPDQRELILTGCSLGSSIEVFTTFSTFISTDVIPFLIDCAHENKLRELWANQSLNCGFVLLEAREYLSTTK